MSSMFAPPVIKPQPQSAAGPGAKGAFQPPTRSRVTPRRNGSLAAPRFLSQRSSSPEGQRPGNASVPETEPLDRAAMPGMTWDFSKTPVLPPERTNRSQEFSSRSGVAPRGVVQPKLVVGAVNDPLEQEADRIADQMMRAPISEHVVIAGPPQVRCKSRKSEEVRNGPQLAVETLTLVQDVLRTPGQPIDPTTRSFFEPRLGHDLSQVRIHSDEHAAK